MKNFIAPFACAICKTEFHNPISLVKHVETEHPIAVKLSNIDITTTEKRTKSGLLIETLIVIDSKNAQAENKARFWPSILTSFSQRKSIESCATRMRSLCEFKQTFDLPKA